MENTNKNTVEKNEKKVPGLGLLDLLLMAALGEAIEECEKAAKEEEAKKAAEKQKEKLPEASPLDLLSAEEYERMDAWLDKRYGPLRDYIDENYVALLLNLMEYEDINLEKKIFEHISNNISRA